MSRRRIKRVDPKTGKSSDASDAIPESTYWNRKLVDPLTGKPSTADNAIPYSVFQRRKKVDLLTGKPSTADDAIPQSTYWNRKKVDPITGKPSTAEDAIFRATYKDRKRKKVDPLTGKPSDGEDAIHHTVFIDRKKLDPLTGEPSTAANAVSRAVFRSQRKVDPVTGKPSTADDAIPYAKFKREKRVDPITGEPSTAANAITYAVFHRKKKVDPITGKPSDAPDAIPYDTYRGILKMRKKVDPVTGEPSTAANAISYVAFRARIRRQKPKDIEIKQEPETPLNRLVLQPDREAFSRVASILRGKGMSPDNCVHLVQAFIDYLLTGEEPTQSVDGKSASFEQATFLYYTDKMPVEVKSEPKDDALVRTSKTVEMVTSSWIDRNTSFGAYAPLGQTTREIDGQLDLTVPPIFDVDYFTQKSVAFTALNETLKEEAQANGGVSFGMVDVVRCGKYVQGLRHCIIYYATSTEVLYVDCQDKAPIIEKIEYAYGFVAALKRVSPDTFGNIVFYTPCCPALSPKRKQADSESEETSSSGQKRKRVDSESKEAPSSKRKRLIPSAPML